jgi:2-haloacid dehalogenase
MIVTAQTHSQKATTLEGIRAIIFDVQGTCVDFFQPILRMGEAVNRHKGLDIDWAALSSEWRDLYRMALDQVIEGKRPWLRVDQIYPKLWICCWYDEACRGFSRKPNEMS